MTQEYIDKIELADAYEFVKKIDDKSVDLIVIDPPYDIDTVGSKKNNISKTFANCNEQLKTVCEGIDLSILDDFMRIMKKPNIYIWCNKKQVIEYLNYFVVKNNCSFEIMTWLKTNPIPLCGGNYLIDKELCLYFRKGVRLNTTFDTASTYWISKKNKMDKDVFEHPTIKPLGIIKTIIGNSSNENDVVFDCFMGSGTTAIACKELGRHFIGCEINPKWHKIANDRVNKIDANGQTSFLLR